MKRFRLILRWPEAGHSITLQLSTRDYRRILGEPYVTHVTGILEDMKRAPHIGVLRRCNHSDGDSPPFVWYPVDYQIDMEVNK